VQIPFSGLTLHSTDYVVLPTHPQHNMSQHGTCLSHMPDVQDVPIPLSTLSHTGDLSMYPNYPIGTDHTAAAVGMCLLLYPHLNTTRKLLN